MSDIISVLMPAADGKRAYRVQAKPPAALFGDDNGATAASKGKAVSEAVHAVHSDVLEGIVPVATRESMYALFLLHHQKFVDDETYATFSNAIREMSAGAGAGAASAKAAQTSHVTFEDGDEDMGETGDDDDDDDDDDDETFPAEEEDSVDGVLRILTSAEFSPKKSHGEIEQLLLTLAPDDVENVGDAMTLCGEWLAMTPAEARKTESARENSWLLSALTGALRSMPPAARVRLARRVEYASAQAAALAGTGAGDEEEDTDAW